jgi:pimeloyl-ACP methyl ester carboxylesterase
MPDNDQFIHISGRRLHYRSFGLDTGQIPLVFLHEGLGSVDLWRDFPVDVSSRSGHPGLVYSRHGYGRSDPLRQARPLDYLQREALDVLPVLIDRLVGRPPILIGHSDGASISIVYAGSGRPVTGLVLLSPHVFVEEEGLDSIRDLYQSFPESELPEKMAKYHFDPETTFRGWAEAWLDPGFRSWNIEQYLPEIRCPTLLIQSEDDEYGSVRQLEAIEAQMTGPVERLMIPGAGHSPHLLDPEMVISGTLRFIDSVRSAFPGA